MNDVDELRRAANPIHEETCRDEHDENETPESDWPCMLLANRVLAASEQGGPPTTTVTMEDAGPEAGHTFEVSVRSRGSSGVLDGPKSDDDWWGEPSVLRVRAWNHNDAVAMAAQVPYPDWDHQRTATPTSPPTSPRVGILGRTVEDARTESQQLAPGNRLVLLSTYVPERGHGTRLDALLITPGAVYAPGFGRALEAAMPALATRHRAVKQERRDA